MTSEKEGQDPRQHVGRASGGATIRAALAAACAGPSPLLAPGSSILIACSGGADSTALLAGLAALAAERPQLTLSVSAGHVDHGLRATSADEARQVETVAARLGVSCRVRRLASLEQEIARVGLEAAARSARYAALAGLAVEAGAQIVVTGHTRRDQAETLLLRLARGAGPSALSGVRERRDLAPGVALVRPLLAVPRSATEALCEELGLPVVHDPQNDDAARSRTRVRQAFADLAALLNPRLEEALAGTATLLAAEDDLLGSLAAAALERASDGQGAFRTADLLALHPALQRRALVMAALAASGRPERQHVEALRTLLARSQQDGPAALHLPGAQAQVARGLLRFSPPAPRARPADPRASEVAEVLPSG